MEIPALEDCLETAKIEQIFLTLPDFLQKHGYKVGEYTTRLAWQVMKDGRNPPSQDDMKLLQSIELMARYHDLGKADIMQEILMKDGPLTQHEYTLIKAHTILGAGLIRHALIAPDHEPRRPDWRQAAAQCCQYHHERWDGSGYPFGLCGQEIPFLARIVSIADAYDAMMADRPYHLGMSEQAALDEIQKNAGTQFDPTLALLFVNGEKEKYKQTSQAS